MNGSSVRALPEHSRLTLIRDAHCRDVLWAEIRARDRCTREVEDCFPDLEGILFDPAGLWIALAKLAAHGEDDPAAFIDDGDRRHRRALVDGEQV